MSETKSRGIVTPPKVKETPRPQQKRTHKDVVLPFKFRKFEDVRAFVHQLNFSSKSQWYAWAKTSGRPEGMPIEPHIAYAKSGWTDWSDFLGTRAVAPQQRRFRPYEQAKNYAVSLNLKGQKEWQIFAQTSELPADIPANPDKIYAKIGWKGWAHFLGTGNVAK